MQNIGMTLSPRLRADYLLFIDCPTPRQCLEAFATTEGVEWLGTLANVVAKASIELPNLPELLANMTPDLVALYVGQWLDGRHSVAPEGEPYSIAGVFTD
jgi:hypothetical protein